MYRKSEYVKMRDPKPLVFLFLITCLSVIEKSVTIFSENELKQYPSSVICTIQTSISGMSEFTYFSVYIMRAFCLWKKFGFNTEKMETSFEKRTLRILVTQKLKKSNESWKRAFCIPFLSMFVGLLVANGLTQFDYKCHNSLLLVYITTLILIVTCISFVVGLRHVNDKYFIKYELFLIMIVYVAGSLILGAVFEILKVSSHFNGLGIIALLIVNHYITFGTPMLAILLTRYRVVEPFNDCSRGGSKLLISPPTIKTIMSSEDDKKAFFAICSKYFQSENYFFMQEYYRVKALKDLEEFIKLSDLFVGCGSLYELNIDEFLRKHVLCSTTLEEYEVSFEKVEIAINLLLKENALPAYLTSLQNK